MPRVIMEAVLSQTPIVTTSVGGITNLLTPSYSAEFVPIRDPAALAKAIHHLLTHKRLQHLYTQRAFDRVTTFLDFPINLRLLTNSWRQAVASL